MCLAAMLVLSLCVAGPADAGLHSTDKFIQNLDYSLSLRHHIPIIRDYNDAVFRKCGTHLTVEQLKLNIGWFDGMLDYDYKRLVLARHMMKSQADYQMILKTVSCPVSDII